MSGPGGIGGNRPTNNIVSYPSTSPNANLKVGDPELNTHGQFVAEQQAANQPRSSLGAAFSKMAAAVSKFFKSLTDRQSSIESPSQPRVSSRRQAAVQASPAAKDTRMKPQLAGQLVQLENSFKAAGDSLKAYPGKLATLIAPPVNSMLGKAITAHAAQNKDAPNLNFIRGLGTGISLGELREKYIFPEVSSGSVFAAAASSDGSDAALCLDAPKLRALMVSLDAAIASGLGNAAVTATFDPGTQTFKVGIQGFRADELSIESTSLMVGLQTQMVAAHTHVMNELMTNSFGSQNLNGLFHGTNSAMKEARNLASEGVTATQNSNDAAQAEIGKLNAMSTPEFADALRADPGLARRLPEMALGSEARQAFMTYAVAQPPGTSMQDKVAGFCFQVKDQAIQEALAAGGMMDAPVQAPAQLPAVHLERLAQLPSAHLDSLAHLLPLSAEAVQQGKSLEGLRAFMEAEYSVENMDFMATGAALLRCENSLGREVPPNFNTEAANGDIASFSLNFDLPVVRQWAELFVGDAAPMQANLSSHNAAALQHALSSMPAEAARATPAELSALTTAMATCLEDSRLAAKRDTLSRYTNA